MAKLALLIRLDARAGKEAEVEALLKASLPLVAAEAGTRSWFALRMAPQIYGIFDTFDSASDREAHLAGRVAVALSEKSSELLSRPPVIEEVEILASHDSAIVLEAVQPHSQVSRAAHPTEAAQHETPKIGSTDAPGG